MNYIDFTIILIAVIGALYGSIKGVIRQIGSLGGFILGIVLSRLFGTALSSSLQTMFDLPARVSDILSYALIFVVVYVACIQLIRLIHRLAQMAAMGWLDRLAGMAFGAIKYLFIISLLFNLINLVDPSGKMIPRSVISSSKCYSYTLKFAPSVFSIAQEQLTSENKRNSDLFILYAQGDNRLRDCKFVKQIKNETR